MDFEMIVGLLLFAILALGLIQLLIRTHCKGVKKKRNKTLARYKVRREEVEIKNLGNCSRYTI